MSDGQRLVDALVRRLDLDAAAADRFRGLPGRGDGLVFGGMLLAQAVVAAGRTAVGRAPHALHGHFLRPARYDLALDWEVERLRDGVAFSMRRVTGHQRDRAVFTAMVGFADAAAGGGQLTHGDQRPAVADPEALPDWEDVRVAILGDPNARRPDGPLDVRECDPETAVPAVGRDARRRLWIRPRGRLPDDPLVHAAVLAFASDRGLLSTAARPHGLMWGARLGASLDHALWIHHAPRLDDWMLFVSESPAAVGGRGLVHGAIYERGGRRIASVAQEGLLRLEPRR